MTISKHLLVTSLLFMSAAFAADKTVIPGTNGIADLTKGGTLTRVNLRWAGPVGIFCGSWRPRRQKITDVRQIQVLSIAKGSPADGTLRIDDVILGADGTGAAKVPLFKGSFTALKPLADAINEAEARNPAILKLLVWRPTKNASDKKVDPYRKVDLRSVTTMLKPYADGQTMLVTIELKTLGKYSDTAPYNCEKSKNVLRQGLEGLYQSDKPGTACLGALCLLAGNDPTNPENDKYQAKAKEWIYKLIAEEKNFGSPWMSGPRLIALSEYYMKTKDKKVFPALVKRAEYHAGGVSWIGTSGHRWADKLPNGSRGRISGYGAINGSGVLGFLGLTLAQKAGVNSKIVDAAVKRQRIFFGHYEERGNIIYGEYYYGINGGVGDENGRHAMPALALGLLGKTKKAKYFTRMATLASSGQRVYAHGGPFMGAVWQPVAAAQGGVKSANLHFREIRWHLDLKRHFNGIRIDDPTHPKYGRFSEAAMALMFYAAPLKQVYVTGRDRDPALTLTDAEFAETAATKTWDQSKLSDAELIASLSKYLGMLRGRAAAELGRRAKADPERAKSIITNLIKLAGDKNANPTGRGGAARAIMDVKSKAKEPVLSMMNAEITKTGIAMVKEPSSYIRYGGGRILLKMPPEAVRPYGDDLMDAILAIDRPTFPLDEDNPCRWDHGVMSEVFVHKVMSQGLDGLDRKKLVPVVRSMLATPMSVARTAAAKGIQILDKEETLGVAGAIIECMKSGAPFNAAGDGAAPNAQKLLAKHRFEEALPLSLIHNGGSAVKSKIPEMYGRAAFSMKSAHKLMQSLGDLMLANASVDAIKAVELMRKTDGPETMPKLKAIHSIKAAQATMKLPASKTELTVDATNYAFPREGDTTYTWRKVYGAGKVSFAPNASGKSKKTTVTFTDRKPGKYRFEVTLSDELGYTEVSKTVDVTLYDAGGKLPSNKPPKATSQTIKTAPGQPTTVLLAGTDPDGDDLGFVVTKGPAHGRLSGVGGKLVYIANFGNPAQLAADKAAGEAAKKKAKKKPKAPSLFDDGSSGGSTEPKKKAVEISPEWTDSITFEAIDGQGQRATGTVTFKISDENVPVAVYDGFDYPAGSIHDKASETSFGFDGPWVNSRKASGYQVERKGSGRKASLSYPSLPSTGGVFAQGQGHTSCSRRLDTRLLSKLKMLEPGGEMWFSFFFQDLIPRRITLAAGPEIKFGVQVVNKNASSGVYATFTGNEAVLLTNRNAWSRSARLRFPKGPNMVICRCIWGKTDNDPDTFEVYRVLNAPGYGIAVASKPVSVVKGPIPQEKLHSIILNFGGKAPIDEIRIGPTQHSVMVGTRPMKTASRK